MYTLIRKTVPRPYAFQHKNGVVKRVKPVVKPLQVMSPTGQLVETSYYIGKSIILFTMFYCTLNWAFYRNLRKQHEEKDKK